jgi:hypothetical protein
MSQAQARAWWVEVEHLREAAERRHATEHSRGEISPHHSALRELDERVVRDRELDERPAGAVPARRRTVKIRGQALPVAAARPLHDAGADELGSIVVDGPWVREQPATPARRRPRRRAVEWIGPRPDRLALWAFIAGLSLVIIALATAH